MKLLSRLWGVISARLHMIVGGLEDPIPALELVHERMKEELQTIREHLLTVLTEEKSLEQRIFETEVRMDTYFSKAQSALREGKEDVAKALLRQKGILSVQHKGLREGLDNISCQSAALQIQEQQFRLKLDSFRTEKEVLKCQYETAQAQIKVNSSLTGLGKRFGSIGNSMDRIKEKTSQAQAKAKALVAMASSTNTVDGEVTFGVETGGFELDREIENDFVKLKSSILHIKHSSA